MKPIKLKSPAVNHFCDDNRQTRRTLKKYLEGTYYVRSVRITVAARLTENGTWQRISASSYHVVLSDSYLIDS